MTTLLVCLLMGGLLAAQTVVGQVGGLPQAPPRDARPEPQAGTASIQGRVTASDTGSPFRRAFVTLMGGSTSRSVYTDDEGRYAFTRLPAGLYTLLANPGGHRAGYQPFFYGGGTPSSSVHGRAQPIQLADGQTLENIDVALPRTAVITGRVTDAAGEPAARVSVQALILRGGAVPTMTGSASTNDLGEFRMFGLIPGDYMIMANPSNNFNGGAPQIEGDAAGFAPAYSPGVPTIADAARIRLGRGTQVTADIRLIETRVYKVSGTVMAASGEPAGGGSLSIVARDSPGGTMFSTSVSGNGTFAFRNIPPGAYELSSRYQAPRPPGAPSAPATQEFGSIAIDVTGDMEHVLIAMTTGAVVTGEVVFDEPFPASGRVNVMPTQLETRNLAGIPAPEVTGSAFTLRGLFGPILLRGNASGGPLSWALKAVLLRGKDITDEPTVFKASDSGHLQMVFTSRAPTLDVSVVGDDGLPALDTTIVIFGHDPKTWKPRSSFSRTAPVGGDGKFSVRGLREGRYYAVAIPSDVMTNLGQPTPEFLETLSAVATAVTLNAGETRALALRLVRFERP